MRQERGAATQTVGDSHSPLADSAFLLCGMVIAAAVLRLVALGRKSFWLDEIASVAISRRPAPIFWHFLWHDEGNMALYYVLLKPWLHFGYSESAVRLLSVIPGVLSIPVMYALANRLFGRQTGILATALLALNACAISVSQEARAYSWLVLLVLLSTYLFVRVVERPAYPTAVAYALLAGVTCYIHYFGVLIPAAHVVSLLALPARERPWKPLLLAWGGIAIMAAPILWLIHAQDVGHISWLQPPSWLELYHLGVFLAADGGKAVGAVLLALELLLAGFFVAALRDVWWSNNDFQRWRYALVASMVLAPVIITLLASIVRPAFYHRFLIICLPGWLLMMAIGLMRLPTRTWRTGMITIVCLLSLVTTGLFHVRPTEDWRGAVAYLIANTRGDDRVLYYQSVGQFAGESYRDWLQPSDAQRPATIGINAPDSGWRSRLDTPARVWLVLYRAKPGDAEARAIAGDLSRSYSAGPSQTFHGITIVPFNRR